MKYIYILPIFLILFLGCSHQNKKEKINNEVNSTVKQSKLKRGERETQEIIIRLSDINLTFNNNTLIYPKQKTVILFDDNSTLSQMQEIVLNKLNVKYVKTDNPYLKNYFKIKKIPTIVVLDKNKTIKYENFVPYEILKAEGF
ncbi:hypothetical protein [Caminibacter sp.]